MEERPCVGQFGLTVQRCVASSQMAYAWPCKLCLAGWNVVPGWFYGEWGNHTWVVVRGRGSGVRKIVAECWKIALGRSYGGWEKRSMEVVRGRAFEDGKMVPGTWDVGGRRGVGKNRIWGVVSAREKSYLRSCTWEGVRGPENRTWGLDNHTFL